MYTNETDRMLADGGVMQEGGTVDPVSGNDVPPGAMQSEVRDDIDAKLSEGEFVIPADVVRYIGLSTLMKMRDKAKEGLKKMEEIGQMGNAEQVPNAEALHGDDSEIDDESFGDEVDSIMSEDMGGEEPAFAEGGYVDPANEPLYKSAPIKGFEMVAMTNASGNTIYIPHVNGKPLLEVPAGYISKKGILPTIEDPTAIKKTTTEEDTVDYTGGNSDGAQTGGAPSGGKTPSISDEGVVTAATTGLSNKAAGVIGTIAGLVTGIPGLGLLAGFANQKANESYAKDAESVSRGIKSGDEMGIPGGATAGAKGTGGQAANAGTTAAAAAVAAGYSPEAVAAAAQAAAEATVNGATPSAAAEAGRAAAATVANDIDAKSATEGFSVGISSPVSSTTVDEYGQVVSNEATPTAVSALDITSTDVGVLGSNDVTAAADNSGNTSGGGTTGAGNEGGGIGAGEGLAKGGFVTKKNKPAVKAKRGLASRK